MYDVVIIGAGVIGTFIARELSRYNLEIAIIDKENDVANGTTKANTAIIHAGYDAKSGTKMARFNVLGNEMFDEICNELDVEFKRTGSLVVAFNEDDMEKVKTLYQRGIRNGVKDMTIVGKNEIKDMEPNISDDIVGGIYALSCGIIDPWNLAIGLAENAVDNGVKLLLNTEVIDINKTEDYYTILADKQKLKAKYVINCAGLYADRINNMVASPSFIIKPRRGQYFVLDKDAGNLFNTVIFQCPSKFGKGVVVAPTVHGNVIIGPNAEDIGDRDGKHTTAEALDYVRKASLRTSSKIPFKKVITTFAGLRADTNIGDFIIEESKEAKGFIDVAGIKSPGLSSAPAIAKYVVKLVDKIAGGLEKNEKFNPIRKRVLRFSKLNSEEKKQIIRFDSKYGRIVCRCEQITEGEIVDCIRRKAGATTVDGVKKRVRPGSGRCQGGFCQVRVMEILARELGKDMSEILKDNIKSYILTGRTNKGEGRC